MARKNTIPIQLGGEDSSLLDVVDSLLNRGVVLNGDLILGVANVDLIYAKLSAVIAALDRLVREQALPGTRQLRKKRRGRKARTKR